MKLQKATRFAIFAILELARDPDRYYSVAEIAAAHGISDHHLAKVLRDLGKAGLVEAVRGVGGGYRFCANPRRVTLLDVIRVFEDVRGDRPAPRTTAGSNPVQQSVDRVLGEIDELAEATLVSISIDTMSRLVAREREREPRSTRSRGAAHPRSRARA